MKRINLFRTMRGNYSIKLSGTIIGVIMFLTLVSNFSFFRHETNQLSKDIDRQGETVVKLLAQSVKAGIFTHNVESLTESGRAVIAQNDFMDVLIFDDHGNLMVNLHDPAKEPPDRDLSGVPTPTELIMQLSRVENNEVFTLETPTIFLFGYPVSDDTAFSDNRLFFPDSMLEEIDHPDQKSIANRIGYVALSISKVRLQSELHFFLWQSAGLAGLMAMIAGVMCVIVIERITKPLANLIKNVRTYAKQQGEGDDLSMLTNNFRELLEAVDDAFSTISTLKDNLEETVTARTLALAQANAELDSRKNFLEESNQTISATLQELKTTQSHLVQSEKMAALGLVVSGVGHEINNTINFISGALPPLRATIGELKEAIEAARLPAVITADNSQYFLANLARRQATTDFSGLLAQIDLLLGNIEEGAKRTTSIVLDLKSFSRASSASFQPTDLHEGLASTLTITRHECRDRVEIVTDLAPELPEVECLGGQINQVFLNILTNAIQAIPNDGRIVIKSWATAEAVYFSFSDSGSGIPAEILPKIFDPFFTTKETGKGTGLGLGISYQIVKKHGGEIRVESELGVGSTFEVMLPIKRRRHGRE